MQRVAEAGRLRVGVEQAVRMIHAAGIGVILSLIGAEPEDRDPALSEATREAILAAVTTDAATPMRRPAKTGSPAAPSP